MVFKQPGGNMRMGAPTKAAILKRLSEIIDPELGIDIVELGLIYGVKISPKGQGGGVFGSGQRASKGKAAKPKTGNGKPPLSHVEVKMTLTSIGCPLAGFFAMQVEEKVKQVPGVADVHVHVVWDPPWAPEMMGKKAKAALGMK